MNFLQELMSDKVTTSRDFAISEDEYRYTVLLLLTVIAVALVYIAFSMMQEDRR